MFLRRSCLPTCEAVRPRERGVRRDGGESTRHGLRNGLLSPGHDVGPEEDQSAARESEHVQGIAQQEEGEDRRNDYLEQDEEGEIVGEIVRILAT